MRKYIGVIFVLFGLMLTIKLTSYNSNSFDLFMNTLKYYWPLIITFIGIYLLVVPRRRRR